MRIALISFEFPPSVALGGIGTYSWHAAHLLTAAGHEVEVFAAGDSLTRELTSAFRVNRVPVSHRSPFRTAIVEPFRQRHVVRPFDVVESPEHGAEGVGIHTAVPYLPRVVRLHTPAFLVHQLNRSTPSWAQRLRFAFGALRRGRFAWLGEDHDALASLDRCERENAAAADAVACPCEAIRRVVGDQWHLAAARCLVSPNLFQPDPELLSIPEPSGASRIVFVGRIEPRKGIFELADAAATVWQRHPGARFTFVGPAMPLPFCRHDSVTELRRRLSRHGAAFEFTGEKDRAGIRAELARADIAVFPSRWENYPNVCLEAMSAGRAVVASSAGGMADMIEHDVSGVLVPLKDATALADAICGLLGMPGRIATLGAAARQRVLLELSGAKVLSAHLDTYRRAIEHAAHRREDTAVSR